MEQCTRTVGMDIGDRYSHVCMLDEAGEILAETRLRTTKAALSHFFGQPVMRVAIEVGAHSPWVSRLAQEAGHEVLVANARRLRAIYDSDKKTDRTDAEMLARIARMDPKLLSPIKHRSERYQALRAVLHARDALVRSRTLLINQVRGTVKAMGGRMPSCSAEAFHKKQSALPETLGAALEPVMATVAQLTRQIKTYDRQVAQLCADELPETKRLSQVVGVGPLTALSFVLTLEEPARYKNGRTAAAFLGLVPKTDQSGDKAAQRRITRAGDVQTRRLLVQCAHYILGPFGPDTDLRRWGLALAERGGNNAKKRAAVAVARKLAALLYALWSRGEVYEPLRHSKAARKRHGVGATS